MKLEIVRAADAVALCPEPLGAQTVTVSTSALDRLRVRARERGRAEGIAEAAALVAQAARTRDGALAQAESDLATLSLGIAERLLGRALREDPAALADLVSQALAAARGREEILLRAHPDDLAQLRPHTARLEAAAGGALAYRADAGAPRGRVRVDTEAGTLECDLRTQLEVLAERMGVQMPDALRDPGAG